MHQGCNTTIVERRGQPGCKGAHIHCDFACDCSACVAVTALAFRRAGWSRRGFSGECTAPQTAIPPTAPHAYLYHILCMAAGCLAVAAVPHVTTCLDASTRCMTAMQVGMTYCTILDGYFLALTALHQVIMVRWTAGMSNVAFTSY